MYNITYNELHSISHIAHTLFDYIYPLLYNFTLFLIMNIAFCNKTIKINFLRCRKAKNNF